MRRPFCQGSHQSNKRKELHGGAGRGSLEGRRGDHILSPLAIRHLLPALGRALGCGWPSPLGSPGSQRLCSGLPGLPRSSCVPAAAGHRGLRVEAPPAGQDAVTTARRVPASSQPPDPHPILSPQFPRPSVRILMEVQSTHNQKSSSLYISVN